MLASLAVSGLVNLAAGATFTYVGLRFVPRETSSESRLANQAFVAYWAAFGLYTMAGGALELLAALGWTPLPVFLAVRYAMLPLMCISIGGLTFYFAYLFTGKLAWIWPITVFFAYMLVAATFYITTQRPVGVLTAAWHTDLVYAEPMRAGAFQALFLFLALPPLIGGVFYVMLGLRLPHGEARRRVLLVGGSILGWTISVAIARLATSSDLLQFFSRPVFGLAVAAAVTIAYRPARASAEGPTREEKLRALDMRMQQLL